MSCGLHRCCYFMACHCGPWGCVEQRAFLWLYIYVMFSCCCVGAKFFEAWDSGNAKSKIEYVLLLKYGNFEGVFLVRKVVVVNVYAGNSEGRLVESKAYRFIFKVLLDGVDSSFCF